MKCFKSSLGAIALAGALVSIPALAQMGGGDRRSRRTA